MTPQQVKTRFRQQGKTIAGAAAERASTGNTLNRARTAQTGLLRSKTHDSEVKPAVECQPLPPASRHIRQRLFLNTCAIRCTNTRIRF